MRICLFPSVIHMYPFTLQHSYVVFLLNILLSQLRKKHIFPNKTFKIWIFSLIVPFLFSVELMSTFLILRYPAFCMGLPQIPLRTVRQLSQSFLKSSRDISFLLNFTFRDSPRGFLTALIKLWCFLGHRLIRGVFAWGAPLPFSSPGASTARFSHLLLVDNLILFCFFR